jgi:hypothetical protein
MLVADPAGAAAEIHRVLRPGGRVALTVWGPRDHNPWLGVVFDVVGAQLGVTLPPPTMPHPFSLADTGQLAALLAQGGLDDVTVIELARPYRGFKRRVVGSHRRPGGTAVDELASLSDDDARELRDRAAEAISVYRTPTGLDIPGVSLLAHGRKSADA